VAYLPALDQLVVACGGDGTVRFFNAATLAPVGSLKLGSDADNVRVDKASGRIAVGYGAGAIALIDPVRREVVRTIPLPAHPEGFQIDAAKGGSMSTCLMRARWPPLTSPRVRCWRAGLRRIT
jgi:hypothetical protein